jgi:ribonuclease HII
MRLAVNRLSVKPELVMADGWAIPNLGIRCEGLVGGDGRSLSIACSSIIAKVYRDRLMERLGLRYPGYGLNRHKGYGTVEHLRALSKLGPSPVHRRTFAPIRSPRLEFHS